MKQKVMNIKPQEVTENGERSLRYKGSDGNYHTIGASEDASQDKTSNLAFPDFVKEVNTDDSEFEVSYKASFSDLTTMRQGYQEPTAANANDDSVRATIVTECDEIFSASDTILVQGVNGYEPDGVTVSNKELVLLVLSCDDTNGLRVKALNGKKIGFVEGCVPSITRGAVLIKMGRMMSAEDATSPEVALPEEYSYTQYCQRFAMQLREDSTRVSGIITASSPLNDSEREVLEHFTKMRNRSMLFGVAAKSYNIDFEEVISTSGIWHLAGKDFVYDDDGFTKESVLDLMREAFTNCKSSSAKVLIGGTDLISIMNKMDSDQVFAGTDAGVRALHSTFGSLYLVTSELFDDCGMESAGMIIDLAYIEKHVKQPLRGDFIDYVDTNGNRIRGLLFTEECAMVLKNPRTHMRITKV